MRQLFNAVGGMKRVTLASVVAVSFLLGGAGAILAWQLLGPRRIVVSAGKSPEELVYARADDDVINGGAFFKPPKAVAKPLAVIWIHGWGVNFYYPTYTMIGRRLAEQGLATFVVNTRMHDVGTVAAYRGGQRIRGGGYWGIPSEEIRDVAAWVGVAEQRGFSKVVLAGHSAGWAPVVRYQAENGDPRVAGVILASGAVQPLRPERDEELMRQARRLMADGRGEDLIRLPNRSFPSFISAANLLDQANTPREFLDFLGIAGKDAAISHVTCPLLAFFGTRGDVGGEADLEAVRSSPTRLSTGPGRIDTAIIQRADHMYTGEEAQVARVIADWAERAILRGSAAR
jgi:pimeloyl-ACP methyl ester carboxylesterase